MWWHVPLKSGIMLPIDGWAALQGIQPTLSQILDISATVESRTEHYLLLLLSVHSHYLFFSFHLYNVYDESLKAVEGVEAHI